MLQIKGLEVKFPSFSLGPINLELQRGDYCVVLGPSGSGKSTLLATLIGIRKPTKGKILLEGRDITFLPPEERKITVVYQDFLLFPHLNVFENIAFGLKKLTKDRNRIKKEVLSISKELDIENLLDKNINLLSGGEKQRVALARSLVVKPKLLLLDEPLSALDPQNRNRIRELIKRTVKGHSITVIHVSHDIDDALNLADKLLFIKKGKVLDFGPQSRVIKCPQHPFVGEFLGLNTLIGRVIEPKRKPIKVKVGGFTLEVDSFDKELQKGDKVFFYFHPSAVQFEGNNTLVGKLKTIYYEGYVKFAKLQVGNFEIKFPLREGDFKFQIGERIKISVPKEDICAVKETTSAK